MRFILLLLSINFAQATILPINDYKIPVDALITNNMTEDLFNSTISKVENSYAPIFQAMGHTLVIQKYWTDETVNAYAQQYDGKMFVSMFGGLARHPDVTPDAFALVVCHEIGHHIGGAPKKINNSDWAGTEGQADYFATNKCLKHVLKGEDHNAVLSKLDIPDYAKTQCSLVFTGEENELCLRTTMAGISLAKMLGSFTSRPPVLKLETRDLTIAPKVVDAHPEAQCRLDTYFSGAICNIKFEDSVSDTDVSKGSCFELGGLGYAPGDRPLCWFYDNGIYLLKSSIEKKDQAKIQFALSKMKSVDFKDIFLMAVKSNYIDVLEMLSENQTDLNFIYEKKKTLMHFAAEVGSSQLIQKLYDLHVSIKLNDELGNSPLHYAFAVQNLDSIKLLINLGINKEAINSGNMTPIFKAVNLPAPIFLELINLGVNLNHLATAGVTPLISAINVQRADIAELMLSKGALVNFGGYLGNIPLHYAVKRNNIELVKVLVNYGADKNKKNNEGLTALAVAQKMKAKPEIINLLK